MSRGIDFQKFLRGFAGRARFGNWFPVFVLGVSRDQPRHVERIAGRDGVFGGSFNGSATDFIGSRRFSIDDFSAHKHGAFAGAQPRRALRAHLLHSIGHERERGTRSSRRGSRIPATIRCPMEWTASRAASLPAATSSCTSPKPECRLASRDTYGTSIRRDAGRRIPARAKAG